MPATGDGLADGHAVLGLDERDVVDDEDARLADRGQLVRGGLGRLDPVAAAVERPGAAERAIPGAAPAELDRGAWVEHADEVLPAMAQEVASGAQDRRGYGRISAAARSPDSVTTPGTSSSASGSRELAASRSWAAAASPSPLSTQSIAPSACSSRSPATNEALWPPTKTKRLGTQRPRCLCQVNQLGNVRQVVARERDHVGPPLVDLPEEVGLRSTCRSSRRTWCPASPQLGGDQLDPRGSSLRKIFVYISELGWTASIFIMNHEQV